MFAFNLGDRVKMVESDEQGTVIGRLEMASAEPQYFVRYKAGDGRQVQQWWYAQDIVATPEGAAQQQEGS